MDWNKLQHTLFALDPTDPREDLAKLKAQASGASSAPVQETVNYLQESAEVREGSLQLDRNYSISDFAALAGVVTEGKQKMGSAGQAKGKDPMPKAEPGRTKHPLKDKLVGEDQSEDRISALEARIEQLESIIGSLTEGAADDILAIAKKINPNASVRKSPEERKKERDAMWAKKAADAKDKPAPAPRKAKDTWGDTGRGYGQGRYMGDSKEDTRKSIKEELLALLRDK